MLCIIQYVTCSFSYFASFPYIQNSSPHSTFTFFDLLISILFMGHFPFTLLSFMSIGFPFHLDFSLHCDICI